MNFQEQALTLDLPTLHVSGDSILLTEPGFQAGGYLAIQGKMTVGLQMTAVGGDPTRLRLNLRFLGAHYEAPADCPQDVLVTVHRVNQELNARLLSELPSPS